MISTADLLRYAGDHNITISAEAAAKALASIDRSTLEATERSRYTAKAWDGSGQPPIGTSDRWLHGEDGSSRSALEAIKNGGVVYFLFRDGNLAYWQPHRADKAGRIHMSADPNHPDHVDKAVAAHIDIEVEREVDGTVLRTALERAIGASV
jgi:hypothetical protein